MTGGALPSSPDAPVTSGIGPDSRAAGGLESLIVAALDRGASDIIFSEGRAPRVRFAGQLEGTDATVASAEAIEAFLAPHMTSEGRARFERTGSVDLSCTLETAGRV